MALDDTLEIRDARATEARALTELCLRSKASWGYDDAFMEQCREALTITQDTLQAWRVRVAEDDNGEMLAVAAYSMCQDSDQAELELLFVEPAVFGQGIGRALLEDVKQALAERHATALWISCDPGAESFYLRLGGVRTGWRPSESVACRQLPRLRLAIIGTAPSLRTERLVLRPWRDEDLAPFSRMNADERVAEYLPSVLTRAESDGFARRIQAGFHRFGFGLWAVESVVPEARNFIGFIGLSVPTFSAPFTPCVEIGWRLAADQWGRGLATEGAKAVITHAFSALRLDELVSFTVPGNTPSRRVMEKLGMERDPAEDFDHPRLAEGHSLRRHVLYRLERSRWTRAA